MQKLNLSILKPLALCGALVFASGAQQANADASAGTYLSALSAAANKDYDSAAAFYMQALVQDPTNVALMESAMTALITLGKSEQALGVARLVVEQGQSTQITNMLIAADLAAREKFDDLIQMLGDGVVVGPLVDGLLLGWAQVGAGQMAAAFDSFDAVADGNGLRAFALYHKALALAHVGDFEGADDIFAGRASGEMQPTLRGVIAHVQILSQLDRNSEAQELMERVFSGNQSPKLNELQRRLAAGEQLAFDQVATPADGAAEVFFTVGSALQGETEDAYALIYARVAQSLRSDHIDAILLSADLLENLQAFELATEAYDMVPRDNPAFLDAELGRADALRRAKKPDTAREVLTQLTESHADQPRVYSALGNLLNREEEFDEATRAYDRAIELQPKIGPNQWFLFYARGISHERSDRWPEAEADFRQALELNPGQPQVLNYLGYSLVEKHIKLDEALEMIEAAVQASPESGYILDSLGWVLFRLGRYEEAVAPMEEAVELMATDPVVNDHLGDVYWAVGRRNEARFQWYRALSFNPEEDEATRIQRKLEIGLDAVLSEEGQDPIHVAAQDG